jgi:hypothetical protein
MPVERYKVGRRYTEREHTAADFADPEAVREVMESLAARDYTVEGRLADAERRATAYLQRANMPIDPSAPPYGDPAWLRANERKSLDWYAINILNTIRMLRKQIERGELWHAVDFALDLGGLAAEAKMIQYMASNPAQGGKTKASQDRRAVDDRIAIYRQQAEEKWRGNPALKASEVARYIKGPKEGPRLAPNYIRKKIADLDPKKR